jgi:hypothetical protein
MFKVGDTVRVVKTGALAKIIGPSSPALPPGRDSASWTIAFDIFGPASVVLPEEIELVSNLKSLGEIAE